MSRIAYVAGQYLPHRQAAVHIEDRGYQFGDGVYEVIAVTGGRLVDEERHLGRLHRSLTELRINPPMNDSALKIVIREVVRRNGVDTGIVYIQVTRGAAPHIHGVRMPVIALPGKVSGRMAVHTSRVPQDGNKGRKERSVASRRRGSGVLLRGWRCGCERLEEQQRAAESENCNYSRGSDSEAAFHTASDRRMGRRRIVGWGGICYSRKTWPCR
jgi:branched-subunit amino acid aminotransferase/4-amino-4-deoxychorismate lyase